MISSDYITYIREIKNKDKILKIQIKILKKDISNLQKELIKNQIGKLEKIYPHTFVREFRLYLKSHEIPFITKFPFNDRSLDCFRISCFSSYCLSVFTKLTVLFELLHTHLQV